MEKVDEHYRSVFSQLQEYRCSGVLCDVVLVTGSRGVRAHSVILAASSPLLKEALEAKTGSSLRYLYLPDYDFATLQVAVKFMYSGRLILNCSEHGEQEQLDALVLSLKSLGLNINGCELEYESILNPEAGELTYTVDFSNFNEPKKHELTKGQLMKLSHSLNDTNEELEGQDRDGEIIETIEELPSTSEIVLEDSVAEYSDKTEQGVYLQEVENLEQVPEKPFLVESIKYLISSENNPEQGAVSSAAVSGANETMQEYDFIDESGVKWKIKSEQDQSNLGYKVISSEGGEGGCGENFQISEVLGMNLGGQTKDELIGEEPVVYATELIGYDLGNLMSGAVEGKEGVGDNLPRVPYVGHGYEEDDKTESAAKKNSKPTVVRSYRTFRQSFRCKHCEMKFSSRMGWKRHLETHVKAAPDDSKDETASYACDKCPKFFQTEAQLDRHEQSAHLRKERIYECRHCQIQFNRHSAFLIHERKHSGERPVLCHLCGRGFAELRLLRAHLKTPHNQFPCGTCSQVFITRSKLAVHNLTEHGIWMKARRERKRRPHLADATGSSYLCDTCGKSFNSSSSLATHTRIHKRVCQVCEAKLDNEADLIEHMTALHPGVEYMRKNWCDLCAKELASEKTYLDHMRLHSNDRPFHCVTCSKTFITRARLVFHLQKVHGSTGAISEAEEVEFATKSLYPCDYCDKTFKWPDARTAHMSTHTGLAPYQCKHCDKRFLYKGSLYAHARIHTGELPYSCHICGKRFRQANHVKRHMHAHQGTKPYSCQLCGKGYMGRIDLRNHYTRVHHVSVTQTRCNARNSYSFNLPGEGEEGGVVFEAKTELGPMLG